MIKSRLKAFMAGAVLFTALLAGTGLSVQAEDSTIPEGVMINGIDTGGMTPDQAKAAVDAQVQSIGQTQITVTVGDNVVYPTLNELGFTWNADEVMEEVSDLTIRGNIVERYKEKKDLENNKQNIDISYTLGDEETTQFVESCEQYNVDPVNAQVYTTDELLPGVISGTDGITLKNDEAVEALKNAVAQWDGASSLSVDLPVERVEPDITADDLSFNDVLGTATTNFSASTAGRWQNIVNGCSKISGSLIWPGETFSVTAAVTPFTEENGYAMAPSYEENQVVESYGGGICQVSTTLYNAVLKAELDVVSRSNHTLAVSYVDLSKDAAIAEGVMDMAFVNSLDNPIYIIGYTTADGLINFTIYGTEYRPANRTIEFVSKTTSETDPASISQLMADPTQQIGYIAQTGSPHTGYTAELWKNIYIDGVLSDSVQINSSVYNAVGIIYDIGVASSSTAWTQAMYNAISQNSLDAVYTVINSGASYTSQTESETESDTASEGTETESETASTDASTAGETDTSAMTYETNAAGTGDTDEVIVTGGADVTYDEYGNIVQ